MEIYFIYTSSEYAYIKMQEFTFVIIVIVS